MKSYLDIENWNRKELFNHFRTLADQNFGIVVSVDVTKTHELSKISNTSFFIRYLHACIKAINSVENLKYRIEDDKVAIYDVVHASATIARKDTTFGFSFIEFSEDFDVFNANFQSEKERILSSTNLFPPKYSLGCIHCSAIPWLNFTGHKEPFSGNSDDSVPQLAFGKVVEEHGKKTMSVAITVNHSLVDGYHVGQFFDKFQYELNKFN
ncbi:chloramphenicol O-acetyltransferase type A [Tenacibaculum adriaticum]|uniref:Chloramphenicol O-acetyltransferase type A n=1 Tax=Tenacibaculum adriaticum TaxID=413713 RepID=A0A5S5DM16_9FLAO|nr:CatA-like O-acetyltransferase [Tenacibaculum adriaticum]TYP96086.1 chloramphenicol O-acetyltransferase type A [Tenacibaculum adriaticum]